MSFEKNFCPSPWFHMRINNSGSYEYCRWKHQGTSRVDFVHNIKSQSIQDYFQNTLAPLRQQFLDGQAPVDCCECYQMEKANKVSGRQRQLLKVGVIPANFEHSLASSPLRSDFDYSNRNFGQTTRSVTDWQIDLGNYCNGGCIFCTPESSSSLATEFRRIGFIDQLPPSSWCNDPKLLSRFIDELIQQPDIRYLHFIGGETLITPAFKTILQALVDNNKHQQISIGLTTNLTLWSDSIADLLSKFNQVNFGMSIETLSPINDYVRYPSKHSQTREYLDRWVKLAQQQNWLVQLRITPTCLTIHDLCTLYEYAWQHELAVESCNFLYKPEFLRIGVLPLEYLKNIQQNLQQWIDRHPVETHEQIINTRNPSIARQQIIQDAQSYIEYINNIVDETWRLPDMVKYLKTLESSRGNCILDYLPQYEQLFRSAGY